MPGSPSRSTALPTLTEAHLRMLRVLAAETGWIALPTLCERAGIAKPTTGRVYLSRLRAILGARVTIDSERDRHGRSVYLMSHLEDGILPRCPHCSALL